MSTGFNGAMLGAPQHSASCFPRSGGNCRRVKPRSAPIWRKLRLNARTVGSKLDLDLDSGLGSFTIKFMECFVPSLAVFR